MRMSHTEAVSLVHKLLKGTHIFSVTNVTKDGARRNFIVNPKAYRAQIKGTGKPADPMAHPLNIKVPDMRAGSWRTINLATLESVAANGQIIEVI